jgi:hypothetical protein
MKLIFIHVLETFNLSNSKKSMHFKISKIKLNLCRNFEPYAIADLKTNSVKPSYSQAKSSPQS